MKKVVLISCVSKKLDTDKEVPASELYISDFFKKNLEYAKTLQADKIYILSALYGLLELDQKILKYDKTLNNMPKKERKKWAVDVLEMIKEKEDLNNTEFIIQAGTRYREDLIPSFPNYSLPFKGLKGIGYQLGFMKKEIENYNYK